MEWNGENIKAIPTLLSIVKNPTPNSIILLQIGISIGVYALQRVYKYILKARTMPWNGSLMPHEK